MNSKNYLRMMATAAILLSAACTAFAQPHVIVDEWGHGSGDVSQGSLLPNPFDPGSPLLLLRYITMFPVLVTGDVQIMEADGSISDVIRFLPTSGIPGAFIFYSDGTDGLDAPADVPFPLDTLVPMEPVVQIPEIGPEGSNYAVYSPGPNDPGYYPGVQYTFISDVPEPSTFVLAGTALILMGLAGLWRRRS